MELFRVFGSLVIDDKEAIKALKNTDKEAKNNQKSLNDVNNKLESIGKAMVAAFSVGAIVDITKKSIEAAANLGAMDAQFNQVFGADSEKMMERINAQSDALNIHTDRLKSSYNSFGAQVKGAGMEAEAALNATEKATLLAADASAFYDTSLSDSSSSLASLMKGNFAAGDAIGVYTNATDMNRFSQEKLGTAWKDLTEAQKQDLILQKVEETYELNGAAGQATREMNNWENVTGNLSSTWERFLGTVGEPVLETATGIINGVTDSIEWLQENLNTVTPVVAGLTAAFAAQAIIGVISKLMGAYQAATTTMSFAQWALNAALSASPLGWIGILIGAVVAAGVALYMNWDKVKATATSLWKTIKDVFTRIKDTISGIWQGVMNMLKMPTIALVGKFSIVPPSVPKLSVKWNAEGGIFSKPTIFNTNSGFQGVGEADPEAILPLNDSVLGSIGNGIFNASSGSLVDRIDILIEVVKSLLLFIQNSNYNLVLDTGVLAGELGPNIDEYLGKKAKQVKRGG